MRSITAAFDDDLFLPGPVIAHGNSKNGISPLISSIHDQRITAVRATHAFTALSPIRAGDPDARAEVAASDADFDSARDAGLPPGDQWWEYYLKGVRSNDPLLDEIRAHGWTEAEMEAAFDRVVDDLYVSENWDQLVDRGVEIFSLPGSHDWVAYDVPTPADPAWSADLHRPQRRAQPKRSPRGAHERRQPRVLRGAALRGRGRAGDARDLRGGRRRRARRHGDLPRGRRARGEPSLLDVRPGARRLVLVPLRPVPGGELGGHGGERQHLDRLDPAGAGAHDHRPDHHPHGHRRWPHAPDQRALHPGAARRHRSVPRGGVLLRPGRWSTAARVPGSAGPGHPALPGDRRRARRSGRPDRRTAAGR